MRKKFAPGILRLLSILYLIFEKRDAQKNCARNFKTRKDTFFNISQRDEQKNCARNFKIRKYAFLILKKGRKKKLLQEF